MSHIMSGLLAFNTYMAAFWNGFWVSHNILLASTVGSYIAYFQHSLYFWLATNFQSSSLHWPMPYLFHNAYISDHDQFVPNLVTVIHL